MNIIVVGAGVAGLAACSLAHERACSPLLLHSGVGASELGSGVVDAATEAEDKSWQTNASNEYSVDEWIKKFFESLGFMYQPLLRVATSEAIVRSAWARDLKILDLGSLQKKCVGVIDLPRGDFRAAPLAASYSSDPWCCGEGISFQPIALPGLFSEDECRQPLASFCQLLDQTERKARLLIALNQLAVREPGLGALLFGPWLGVRSSFDASNAPMPYGEALSPPDGPSGLRFAQARSRFLRGIGVHAEIEKVVGISAQGKEVRVESTLVDGRQKSRNAQGVIVATGGLIGGGIGIHRFQAGAPADLLPELGLGSSLPLGAREGWDAARNGASWVLPPHSASAHSPQSNVQFAGDVRSGPDKIAPLGTLYGAALSGKMAMTKLLESLSRQ